MNHLQGILRFYTEGFFFFVQTNFFSTFALKFITYFSDPTVLFLIFSF